MTKNVVNLPGVETLDLRKRVWLKEDAPEFLKRRFGTGPFVVVDEDSRAALGDGISEKTVRLQSGNEIGISYLTNEEPHA